MKILPVVAVVFHADKQTGRGRS